MSADRTIRVRISATIAGELESRTVEEIPERLREEGMHQVTREEAQLLLDDAAYNSDLSAFDVGPYGMPLGTFNAYRALARQLRRALAD